MAVMQGLVNTLSPNDKVMIFTLTRRAAGELKELINNRHFDRSQSGDFEPIADIIVGHGRRGVAGCSMTSAQQIDASKRFKDGEFNILVSTSVSKEGIDVGSCRIGIEHGKLKTSTELTQFMVGCL